MRRSARQLWWLLAVIGVFAVVAAAWWMHQRSIHFEDRVYRIGWQPDPPFQTEGPDGSPAGLAVDLVKGAAARQGIRLQWVRTQADVDEKLISGELDLHVLLTRLPRRKGRIYQSEPYLETQLCYLVKEDSPFRSPADLAQARIGVSELVVERNYVAQALPNAELQTTGDFRSRIGDLCEGRSDAVFVEGYRAIAELLRGESCSGQALRWISIPDRRPKMGLGANLKNEAVADVLRSEISAMAADGRLAQTFGQWGFMTGQNLEKVEQLVVSQRRERLLTMGVASFAFLFLLALLQAIRIRKERNNTQKAERALRLAEQKLRLVANNLSEMVLAYDLDRRLIYANQSVETITGYTAAELQANGYLHWVYYEDRPVVEAAWESLFAGQDGHEYEYRVRTKHGDLRWLASHWTPLLNEGGVRIGVQGSARDITTRKQVQLALQESERRFRKLLESVRLYAVVFDLNGTLTFCNDYLLDQTGFERSELEGGPLDRILPEWEIPRIRNLVHQLAETGEPLFWHGKPKIQTKDGLIRHVETHNVLLHDAGGKAYAVATIGVDVTDHLLLQQQYLQAQKLESVGRLAGGVAHDFNNLLTVIIGSGQLAALKLGDAHPARSHLANLLHAGEQAAELTRQLLAFSRKQLVEPKAIHLGELVEETAALLRRLMGANIELRTHTPRGLWMVRADRSQMQQVLLNLAVNARDAMPDGGLLRIVTSNGEFASPLEVPHPDLPPGQYVQVTVSDTGVGMDDETRERIFEPFYTTKGVGKGTGLGLATVYGIIRQCGGWILVESRPGQGSTFRIFVPRTEETGDPAAAELVGEAVQGQGTVLLVEDQPEVRRMTTAALANFGYSVLEAGDGVEALKTLEANEGAVDLLLTDVILPGMNGRELAEEARRRLPGLKVLFASGYTQEVIANDGVLHPGVAYLAKPFSLEALASKVQEVLRS